MIADLEFVLDYWFGGDQQVNYKTKWFADGETQSTTDKHIIETFEPTLQAAMNRKLEHWKTSLRGKLALIVVLDQFSRHIYRFKHLEPADPARQQADSYALELTQSLCQDSIEMLLGLQMEEFVFALMPLRHSSSLTHYETTLSLVQAKEQQHTQAHLLLNKFRRQTIRRYQDLLGKSRGNVEDILERDWVPSDETSLSSHALLQSTVQFLKTHYPVLSTPSCPESVVMISLSGGVDSMVLMKILHYLSQEDKSKFNIQISHIVAIHIDYNNREESMREREFLEEYCHAQDIVLYSRIITEVL
ncbi:DUF924 family protein [archaeon]|nr:MAG: DUF924 family protein [archaeon]